MATCYVWCIFVLLSTIVSSAILDNGRVETLQQQYNVKGNISLSAIFDVHEENCSGLRGKGLVEAAAAVWAVAALNHQQYLPDGKIGLAVYDGCSESSIRRRALVEVELNNEDVNKGTIATREIEEDLKDFSPTINRTLIPLDTILDTNAVLTMIGDLLKEMNVNTVHRIIADSLEVLNNFARLMTHEGICVYDQVLINDIHAVYNDVLQPTNIPESDMDLVSTDPCVIIVFTSSRNISRFSKKLPSNLKTNEDIKWFLVPSDFFFDNTSAEIYPKTAYVVSAVSPELKVLQTFLQNPNHTMNILNHRAPLRTPFFLPVAHAILQTLAPRIKYEESYLTGEKIQKIVDTFYLSTETELFLFTVFDIGKNDDIAVFRIFDKDTALMKPLMVLLTEHRRKRGIFRLGIADIEKTTAYPGRLFVGEFATHPCYEPAGNLSKTCGICFNFVKYLSKVAQERQIEVNIKTRWRYEIWVGINISIASIGVLCCLSIISFILYRMFRGDFLEGSPFLSFLLLFSIIFCYICTIPYSMNGEDMCDFKMLGPPLGFNLLFSILFARSLMLASSDREGGFMSHVNGYLQTIHFIFLFLVQVVFSVQNWYLNSGCSETNLLILHAYDGFLLILLLFISPFTYKSKRNYNEGFYFTISIILIVLIWCIWLPLYYFLPYKDAIVSLSLTLTATVLLLTTFIPRTYLMVSSMVRERIVSTLPPFRSTQNLYEVTSTTTPQQKNQNSPQILPGEYFSSECGLVPPTPTRHEHVYDSMSSPNRVTRF